MPKYHVIIAQIHSPIPPLEGLDSEPILIPN